MFWWAVFMWANTPIHLEDLFVWETPEIGAGGSPEIEAGGSPEQDSKAERDMWRWTSLALRLVGLLAQVLFMNSEFANEVDFVWLRYLSAGMLVTNITLMRVDFCTMLYVQPNLGKLHRWLQNLPQMSAMAMVCVLCVDILAHVWCAYVQESVVRSGNYLLLHDGHWVAGICLITVRILPELLYLVKTEENKAMPATESACHWIMACFKFVAFPFYLGRSVCGFHALVELLDVVSFIWVLKDITQNKYNPASYIFSIGSPNIQLVLFSMLTGKMLIWILPTTYVAFEQAICAEKFKMRVLQFSMVVEFLTDIPELVFLILWDGWRGEDGSWFVIFALTKDALLTFKNVTFMPYQLCCPENETTEDVEVEI